MRRIVVKFGGTSLGNGERIRLAAKSVEREWRKGAEIVVTVSAMGHTTDELLEVARKASGENLTAKDLDDILAMGERTSARIFAAALRSLGVKAKAIDPEMKEWPIITDSSFSKARVDEKRTEERVKKYLEPLLKERIVPVVCGFLGRNLKGEITTLGRGGSDTTAFILGKYLRASEVIIVTDVEGVMTADVNEFKDAKLLKSLTALELRELGRFGARVMHPAAMNYKLPEMDAKVIHFRHGDLSARGTTIKGGIVESGKMEITLHEKPIGMLTVVGEGMQETPGVLLQAISPLSKRGLNILGVSIGPRSFSLYVWQRDLRKAVELVHQQVKRSKVMKSVTSEDNLALVVVESEKFIDTPGMIAKLTAPLAREGINIVEILSSRASISFFFRWEDRERAVEALRRSCLDV
ncbi:MAG: aspartate kinase [Hadesarchaea archaeon]|nr:MAG: aspartate kinase [Hadesarchaea archaeon]TDA34951.1 MAG: aspartate kinase [Hadesarchaea archaeon]